jgi:TM2 domain-containing membrane protein YozV
MTTPIPQVETSAAYVLWLLCLCGVCGGQRFYSGKIASGLIYLFTFGLFGFGQLLDLLLIPGMVEKRNIYLRGLYARNLDLLGIQPTITLNMGALPQPVEPFLPVADPAVRVSPMQKLLQVANDHGGTVSLAQVALHLGLEPEEIKSLLQEAERHGYAEICNDPETGAIRYRFDL